MKTCLQNLVVRSLFLLAIGLRLSPAQAQGTAFTYQGRLNSSGAAANGSYDLAFTLFATNGSGVTIAGPVTNSSVAVTNGLFTTLVDFGNAFTGASNWLEIAVSTTAANNFTTLAPRQQITPVPYALNSSTAISAATAMTAMVAGSANSVSAANISGALSTAQLPTTLLTNGASGVNISGTFTGNGMGVTNISVNSLMVTAATNFSIIAWGDNSFGETNVPAGLSNVVTVAAGYNFSLALRSDGTIAAWGENLSGQATVPAGLSNVVVVAAGEFHSLALKADSTVVAWGNNFSGQGTVPVGLSNVVTIAAGESHNLVVKSDGTVVAWGDNYYGAGTVPAGLSNVVAVAAGISHNVALKSDGTVVAWGYNDDGEANVPAGLSNVVAVAAGAYHSLALKSDGTVVAWGANNDGDTIVPAGLNNVVAVAAGHAYSLALKSDGTVVAWGYTTVPAGLNHVLALATGCEAQHVLVIQQQPVSMPFLNANNTFNGNIQVNGPISASGYVGIGTTTPDRPLAITGVGGGGDWISLKDTNGATRWHINNSLGGLNFVQSGIADYRLFLSTNGNVGIGTNNPASKLDVSGDIHASGTFIGNGSGLTGLNAAQITSGTIPLPQLSGVTSGQLSAATWQAATNLNGGNAALATNVVSGINITNALFTGNVGIGTASPDRPLAITQAGSSGEWISLKDATGVTRWHINNNGGGLDFVQTAVQDFRLFLSTNNGYVGIGTATPGSALDVLGNIHASGTLNGNGSGLTSLNASQITSGTIPLAQLSGVTSSQLSAATWQAATNLNGGNAALATNVVSGISLTNPIISNAVITNSILAGNGSGLTNLNASQITSGTVPLAQLPGVVVTNLSAKDSNENIRMVRGSIAHNGVILSGSGFTVTRNSPGDFTVNFSTAFNDQYPTVTACVSS